MAFSAVFSGYGTPVTKFSIKFGLEWPRCPLAVSDGSWSKFEKGQISAVFSGYGTHTKNFSIKFGLEWPRCPLAVSGGTWLNFENQ